MDRKIDVEVASLARMTITELVAKYVEVFGEHTRSRQRLHLIRRIAWRVQSLAEGDLTERARKRAIELARDTDVRQTPPRAAKADDAHVVKVTTRLDPRLPAPGSQLVRHFKGEDHVVTVLVDGFQYEGKRYKSLTAVALAITKQHVSGFAFFKLEAK